MKFAEMSLSHWLDLLASKKPTPAGGSLAYVTLAGQAALFAKIARLKGNDPDSFIAYSKEFLADADADAEAYPRMRKEANPLLLTQLLEEELDRAKAVMEFIESATVTAAPKEYVLIPDHEAVLNLSIGSAATILENIDSNIRVSAGKGIDTLGLLTRVNYLKSRLMEYKERAEYQSA